ncbi:MAG: FAD-binding protein, partial [Trichodesmium sp. St17_bin3_1_1]|nr:FAD-binding protein [Trichodesmium sp. St17_bin3_1_1]
HYSMGGIPTNTDGRVLASRDSLVDGLFAAGECACVSVHGANRLGSNSLLECVVYGRRTGAAIAEFVEGRKLPDIEEERYLKEARAKIQGLLDHSGEYRINFLREQFQDAMSQHCGVFRSQDVMEQGFEKLEQLQQQYQQVYLDDRGKLWNTEIIEALELRSIIVVGETILSSALSRKESRGAHSREDFTERNDEDFLRHTLAYYSLAGIDIGYRPVTISMFEPKERKY